MFSDSLPNVNQTFFIVFYCLSTRTVVSQSRPLRKYFLASNLFIILFAVILLIDYNAEIFRNVLPSLESFKTT